MILHRPAASRGRDARLATRCDTRLAFSFGDFHDPDWTGLGVLRVFNEARAEPGAGLVPSGRRANMEILSYVLDGRLAWRDAAGAPHEAGPGELHWLGAGHGLDAALANASADAPLHLVQAWLQPDRVNAPPQQAVRAATPGAGWQLLASPDGAAGSLVIRQQARLYRAALEEGAPASFDLDPHQRYWLHVARGAVESGGSRMAAGDAVAITGEDGALQLRADAAGAELLLLELPG